MTLVLERWRCTAMRRAALLTCLALIALGFGTGTAFAHAVTPGDAGYIQEIWGVHLIPFTYLGAKHMVTGYDTSCSSSASSSSSTG